MRIINITNGPRQSNIELLRIIAMFLVLVVHTAFMTTGAPTKEDISTSFIPSLTKIGFESLSIVCVNVFILISGWFGIKPSVRGFCGFVFQCLYFFLGIYIVLLSIRSVNFSIKTFASCFCLYEANWFILSYIGLYIISPILNIFAEKASKRQLSVFLISFYVFQSIWGWSSAAKFVEQGYSTFSFIGLYLLARYIRLYGSKKLTDWGGAFYALSIIINMCGYYIGVRLRITIPVFSYVNPMVIGGALGLLLFFNKLKINTNKIINFIAKSVFAVFLIHTFPLLLVPVYQKYILMIYNSYYGIGCLLYLCLFLVLIYVIAIILDQPRKILWHKISKKIKLV